MAINVGDIDTGLRDFSDALQTIRRQTRQFKKDASAALARIAAVQSDNAEAFSYLTGLDAGGADTLELNWMAKLERLTAEATQLDSDLRAIRQAINGLDL